MEHSQSAARLVGRQAFSAGKLGWLLAAATWCLLPLLLPRHHIDLMVFAGIYSIAGLGVGLLLGQCGIVNLSQALFFGIGAFSSAYVTVKLGHAASWGFVSGAVINMTVAVLVGWPVLRLSGYFLALATLALSLIGSALFYEWDSFTGGSLGVGGIPHLALAGIHFESPQQHFYLIWAIVLCCMLLARNLQQSRTGLMLRGMRDSGDAAASLGISLHTLRVRMFVLCALFGSLAGSLYAHYATFVSVEGVSVHLSISLLLIPVLGGVTSIPGIVIGALFITLVPEFLSQLGAISQILFGMALTAVVVVMPNGIVGSIANRQSQRRTSRESSHGK